VVGRRYSLRNFQPCERLHPWLDFFRDLDGGVVALVGVGEAAEDVLRLVPRQALGLW